MLGEGAHIQLIDWIMTYNDDDISCWNESQVVGCTVLMPENLTLVTVFSINNNHLFNRDTQEIPYVTKLEWLLLIITLNMFTWIT